MRLKLIGIITLITLITLAICLIIAASLLIAMSVPSHATDVTIGKGKSAITVDVKLTKAQKKQVRYVKKWSKRIQKYVKSSPFKKHVNTVVNAAYKHKVDPRHIVVVAKLESGLGKKEFRKNNSWGWYGKLNLSTRGTAIKSYAKKFGKKYGKRLYAGSANTYSGGSSGYYSRYCGEWGKI